MEDKDCHERNHENCPTALFAPAEVANVVLITSQTPMLTYANFRSPWLSFRATLSDGR